MTLGCINVKLSFMSTYNLPGTMLYSLFIQSLKHPVYKNHVPVLWEEKLRHREVNHLTQGYSASKWHCQNSSSDLIQWVLEVIMCGLWGLWALNHCSVDLGTPRHSEGPNTWSTRWSPQNSASLCFRMMVGMDSHQNKTWRGRTTPISCQQTFSLTFPNWERVVIPPNMPTFS